MLITNCAACAAPLAHDAPRCVRCKTRYCNSTCQHDHWRGHKQICKIIHRGGDAEQYHADNRYKEAVTVAVEKCADDTKGQTCYICTEAVHWKTKEGLVRGCACRGTAGFAHVSCLAEQAKILVAEAEENNLDDTRFARWHTCSLCEQDYHGVVRCALGWACWKTYVGRPEGDQLLGMALNQLGNGLQRARHHDDALSVQEVELSMLRRIGVAEHNNLMLNAKGNLAATYYAFGRLEDSVLLNRDVYSLYLKHFGEEHEESLLTANNYALALIKLGSYVEAKSLLRRMLPVARRVLGEANTSLSMKKLYGLALYTDPGATLDDLREAVTTLEETERIGRRLLGGTNPIVGAIESLLLEARYALRARETPPRGSF